MDEQGRADLAETHESVEDRGAPDGLGGLDVIAHPNSAGGPGGGFKENLPRPGGHRGRIVGSDCPAANPSLDVSEQLHGASSRPFVLRVQRFSNGGYEAVGTQVDLVHQEKAASNRPRGPRAPRPDEQTSLENIERAGRRAKRQVRYAVREMRADRLLTLTTREQRSTPEVMLDRWQRWLRLLDRRKSGRFHYVAVLERHPSNPEHLHIHVAIAVFLPVDVLRECWWQVCGGRAMGNVHIKRLGGPDDLRRVSRVASYISKYVMKESIVRFNKKRYWVSRVGLTEIERHVLGARNVGDAYAQAKSILGFSGARVRDEWISVEQGVFWVQRLSDCDHRLSWEDL